jgi:hypothetical protein
MAAPEASGPFPPSPSRPLEARAPPGGIGPHPSGATDPYAVPPLRFIFRRVEEGFLFPTTFF